jgi:hypothetical protein
MRLVKYTQAGLNIHINLKKKMNLPILWEVCIDELIAAQTMLNSLTRNPVMPSNNLK